MEPDRIARFAEEWIDNWNHHRLDAILLHYTDEVLFTSPRATALTGSATIHGKEALRRYWSAAIARTTARRFTLDRTLWDAAASELVILYISDIDGRRVRAAEVFRFDRAGQVTAGEALYGAECSTV
jgi:hypothetical protein